MAKVEQRLFEGFDLDRSGGVPVWIQVKNRVAYLIGSGVLVEGDQLPTVRALAVDLDISYNTVNRAYMDLEREGYISTRRGRGTFVAKNSDNLVVPESGSPIELLVDDVIRKCRESGMDDFDIVDLVKLRLRR